MREMSPGCSFNSAERGESRPEEAAGRGDPGGLDGELLTEEAKARRDFMQKVGKFALVTPPVVTTLLATSMNSDALALSGGGGSPPVHSGPPPIRTVSNPPQQPLPPAPKPPAPTPTPTPRRSVFDDLIAKCIDLFS